MPEKEDDPLLFIDLVPATRRNHRPDRCPDDPEYNCTDSRILPTGGVKDTEARAILVARNSDDQSYCRACTQLNQPYSAPR